MKVCDLYNILAIGQDVKIVDLWNKNLLFSGKSSNIPISIANKQVKEIYTDDSSNCLYAGVASGDY